MVIKNKNDLNNISQHITNAGMQGCTEKVGDPGCNKLRDNFGDIIGPQHKSM